jgi:hypothetical protein
VDRASMHVVEHHDDFFSWKIYYNDKHVLEAAKIKKGAGREMCMTFLLVE